MTPNEFETKKRPVPPPIKIPSTTEQAAMNLRALMLSKDGDEKCILCKAADELEKTAINPTKGCIDWAFPFLIMMLFSGWGNSPKISPEVMKNIIDDMEKEQKSEENNNG